MYVDTSTFKSAFIPLSKRGKVLVRRSSFLMVRWTTPLWKRGARGDLSGSKAEQVHCDTVSKGEKKRGSTETLMIS